MASTDASAYPIKNAAWRVTFPIFDADGDLVTGATGLDSEVSKDGGTFADCTNEATEIATSSGIYYLDLTSTEMNADTVAIIVKTSTVGAKTTAMVTYPITTSVAKLGVNLVNIAGAAVSTSTAQLGVNVVNAAGTAWGSGAITAASIASDAITAAKIADNAIDAAAIAANAITSAKIATDAIGADQVSAAAVTKIQSGLATASALATVDTNVSAILVDTGTSLPADIAAVQSTADAIGSLLVTVDGKVDDILADTGTTIPGTITTLQATADAIETDTQDIQGRIPAALVSGRIDASVGAMAANVLTASALAADAVDEIWDEVMEGTTTARQSLRLANSANGAIVAGAATTTVTIRDLANSKDRVTATVDADGNRSAVTLDLA